MEFQTLQSFSLARSRAASRRPLPSCHSSRTPGVDLRDPRVCRTRMRGCRSSWDLSDVASRRCSPGRVRCSTAPLSADGVLDALLGFGPLQGCPSSTSRRRASTRLLPRAFGRRHSGHGRRSHRTSITLPRLPGVFTRSGVAVLSSARRTLVGFPTSSTSSSVEDPSCPGSWFHLGCLTSSRR